MWPILLTLGSIPISAFGFFLLISLLLSSFIIWRLSQAYEFESEKVIDLILLTFIGGLVFSRFYFVLFHLDQFKSFYNIFLINRYPGLSFWGAFFGGVGVLKFFSKRLKIDFFQIGDIFIVGLFAGLSLASLGCLLGSCGYGQISNWGVVQVGVLGKRFPLQIVESVLSLGAFFYLWKRVLRFHSLGSIASLGLILLGFIKLLTEFFRGDPSLELLNIRYGFIWSILIILVGIYEYYKATKRSVKHDFSYSASLIHNTSRRKAVVSKINKSWYNFSVNFRLSLKRWKRSLQKLLNIKSRPTNF